MINKVSGRFKGSGFVLFRHWSSSRHALRRPQKLIDGRMGEIEEGPIGFVRNIGKPKGHALFVYKTVEGAMRALEEPYRNFEGIVPQCERANDKNKETQYFNTAAPLNAAPSKGNLNGPGYTMHVSDIGLAQQAALTGQGFLGMGGAQAYGQAMQSNAAVLALLAAAWQNPAAFGMTPSVLTLNPSFATTFGAAGSQQTAPTLPQMAAQAPNYGAASSVYQGSARFQGATGFQGSPGFLGPPGFQGPHGYQSSQSVTQSGSSYPTGTAPVSR
ncbi:UBP1-associated protein 2B-like [Zingiber officinale]|uniref:UBP1-associated protein 2B-like n=1 Tax=Zingiber officinale TaxID=94328 RepID=UPI001C4D96E4|nr:UBP1-associated protein 2B-like [Zingiber officinale]